MRKWMIRIMACWMLLASGCAWAEGIGPAEYTYSGKKVKSYVSDTLKYQVERLKIDGVRCYLSKIWVKDPAAQIRKATAEWKKDLKKPGTLAEQIEGAALVINGSGYVSPLYPEIPDNYPGTSEDYFYTPLGSLTVTHGEVFRNLEGVPYTGLTLGEDGLSMHMAEDNETVLAAHPLETWSFYVECPMLRNNEDLLPADWPFADRRARRTVIARVNRNNYLILNVTNEESYGLTLRRVSEFFRNRFETEWVYNLDGGPSSALLCREKGKKRLVTLMGGRAKDADILAFTE